MLTLADTDASIDTITSFVMLLAIIQAGYTAFPISTRNSAPAVVHLLTRTETVHLIVGPEDTFQRLAGGAFEFMRERGQTVPHTQTMPLFQDIFWDEHDFKLLPTFETSIYDVALYLHSSGTCSVMP